MSTTTTTNTATTTARRRRRRICLFGTSANPPTGQEGHVGIVQALASMKTSTCNTTTTPTTTTATTDLPVFVFDEIRVVPVYSHPFAAKRALLAPFEHRLEMCRLACGNVVNVVLSDAEQTIHLPKEEQAAAQQEQEEPLPISVGTADLLEYYQSQDQLQDTTTTNEYTLCLGMDTFLDLMGGKWRRTRDILELVQGRFVVLFRQESDTTAANVKESQQLETARQSLEDTYGPGCCQFLHVPTLGAVSSTLVRSLSRELSQHVINQGSDHEPETTLSPTTTKGSTTAQDIDRLAATTTATSSPLDDDNHQDPLQLHERPHQMVTPKVLDYMREYQLYGFRY